MSIIGANIKNIRAKKNIAAKELSKKCGLSESVILDIESGRKIPNANMITAISKALGVQIDAIEPSYLSDYYEEEAEKSAPTYIKPTASIGKVPERIEPKANTLSDAINKAIRKIPVLSKLTPGKKVPFEGDIVDYKFEPVFQGKTNNVAGENFIYYMVSDNSLSGSRILKNDLALVFLTDSINDKDMVLFVYNNKVFLRRLKAIDDKSVLLYPDNPDFEVLIANRKDLQLIGKVVRVEFKI